MTLTTLAPLAAVPAWLYVTGCLVIPLAWGVLTELVFRAWAGKRGKRRRHPESEDHFLFDYQI